MKIPVFVGANPPFVIDQEQIGTWIERASVDFKSDVARIATNNAGLLQTIPDGLAAPLLFDSALFEQQHPMHSRAQRIWRMLLAALALRKRLGLKIAFPPAIPLGQNDRNVLLRVMASATGRAENGLPGVAWNPAVVIVMNGWPIALASPLTLVAPAAAFFGAEPSKLAAELDDKAARHRQRLRESGAGAAQVENDPVAGALAGQAQLARALVQCAEDRFLPGGELAHLRGTLAGWLKWLKGQMNAVSSVQPSESAAEKIADQIERFIQFLGYSAGGTPLPPLRTGALEAVSDEGNIGRWLRAISPQNCFTARLAYLQANLDGSRRLNTQWMESIVDGREFIAPLDPDWLSVVAREGVDLTALARSLRIHAHSEGWLVDVTVDGVPESHLFRHLDTVELSRAPVAVLWPNLEGWKRYYLHCFTTAALVDGATGSPTGFMVKMPHETFRFERDRTADRVSAGWYSSHRTGASDSPPKFFSCFIYEGPAGETKESCCGVLLAPSLTNPQPPPGHRAASWVVAVDFGTTSTVTWHKRLVAEGNATPNLPLAFSQPDLCVLSGNAGENQLREHFLQPGSHQSAGFLTLLNVSESPTSASEDQWPLTKVNIFLPPGKIAQNFFPPSVRDNLKWGTNGGAERNVRAFLLQLLLQITAKAASECVERIFVRYTYPTAMSVNQKAILTNAWVAAAREVEQWTGIGIGFGGPNNFDVREGCVSEAVATGFHFRSHRVELPQGAVTMDIGGGTTDIGLWGGDVTNISAALRLHGSILYAGRDILLQALRRHVQLFATLDQQIGESDPLRTDEMIRAAEVSDWRVLETIVRQRGDLWLERMGKTQFSALPRSLIAVRLGALYFYAGLFWRYHQVESPTTPAPRALCCGGSAAQLVHWLSPIPNFGRHFACTLFEAGAGIDLPNLQFTIGGNRKLEVVQGLLDDASLTRIDPAATRHIAGESFQRNTTDHGAHTHLIDFDGVNPRSLENFKSYLIAYNRAIGKDSDLLKVKLLPANPDDATLGEKRILGDLRIELVPGPPKVLRPLFFMALEAYLERSKFSAAS